MGVIGKQIFEKGPKFCGSTMNLNSMCLITASVIINSSKHEKKKFGKQNARDRTLSGESGSNNMKVKLNQSRKKTCNFTRDRHRG